MKKITIAFVIMIGFIIQSKGYAQATHDPNVYDANSSIITNDVEWWYDDQGDFVVSSMGGHITKIGDRYYWVGNDPRQEEFGYDIRIYSSKNLGSNSWRFEAFVEDKEPNRTGSLNCTLLYNEKYDNYVIITKGITFFESKSIQGPWSQKRKVKVAEKFPWEPLVAGDEWHTGGMSAFQDGDDAYIIVSTKTKAERDRWAGIWKLTDDFLNVEKIIAWESGELNREAFWLFKKDKKYYMTYDGPGGWRGSESFYRIADRLEGPWSEEYTMAMIPDRTGQRLMRSHASQVRWIINVDGQWMFGGDRYPFKEPASHPPEKGLYVWCPVIWDGDHMTVKFEKEWDVKNHPSNTNTLGVDDISKKGQKLLVQNYPNPFSERTAIKYHVSENLGSKDKVALNIYNVKGQLVKKFINQKKAPGEYTIEWDGTSNNGKKVSSGIYIAEMTLGSQKNRIKLFYSKN